MFIYSLKKRFDPHTGEEVDPILTPCGKICDYTGNSIDSDDLERRPIYTTTLYYDRGCEEAWYYDDERMKLEDELGIPYEDFAKFIESPYHFEVRYDEMGFGDVSLDMMAEWMSAIRSESGFESSELKKCTTLDQVFRSIRYRTLFGLLREGKYKLKDFGMIPLEND